MVGTGSSRIAKKENSPKAPAEFDKNVRESNQNQKWDAWYVYAYLRERPSLSVLAVPFQHHFAGRSATGRYIPHGSVALVLMSEQPRVIRSL